MHKRRLIALYLFMALSLCMQLYAENDEPMYRYKLSIAGLFQNENFFMKEWIEYHRMVGVEYFLLYNNNSTEDWQSILEPYIKEGLVEVINWTDSYNLKKDGKKTQQLVYEDAIARLSGVSRWVALIDFDEFLLPKKHATVSQLLDERFALHDAVCVSWDHFGTGNKTLAADDSILFSLTKKPSLDYQWNRMVKSIVRPEAIDWEKSKSIHWYVLKEGYSCVDGHGDKYQQKIEANSFTDKVCTDYIQLNHYRMGDDWYWHTVKKPRLLERLGLGRIYAAALKQYRDCNKVEDVFMSDFIKNYHPEKYEQLWKDGKFKRL